MSFMAKSMYTQINSEALSRYIQVNCRHTDDVKFVNLVARPLRLHFSVVHAFLRLWDELPKQLRIDFVTTSLKTWLKSLKESVCCC